MLAVIAAETIQARPLDDDGHFSLIFAGRTTRAQAATALGDTVQADQSGADEVIVIAFDGAFVPPSTPAGVTPNRAQTLAYIVNSDGLVTDLAVRNVPFVAPDTVLKAGFAASARRRARSCDSLTRPERRRDGERKRDAPGRTGGDRQHADRAADADRRAEAAEVWVKLEAANPTGSYKDRMALAMIEGAERRAGCGPARPSSSTPAAAPARRSRSSARSRATRCASSRPTRSPRRSSATMRAFGADARAAAEPGGHHAAS